MLRSIPLGNVGRNDIGYSDHRDLEAVLDCIDTEKLAEALSPPAGDSGPPSLPPAPTPHTNELPPGGIHD